MPGYARGWEPPVNLTLQPQVKDGGNPLPMGCFTPCQSSSGDAAEYLL